MKQTILGVLIFFTLTAYAQGQWTWIGGDSTNSSKGFYGQKGIANPNNVPSARIYGATWTDHKNGDLYLFGGAGGGWHNDLWKWDGKNWIWINGDSTKNNFGRYGQKKIANPNNQPGSRVNSISWIDSKANLWLFGGDGYANSSGGGELSRLNDLWKWDGENWTWMSGDSVINQTGNYGLKGISDATNKPGARNAASGWVDNNDHLWLYGGRGLPKSIFNPDRYHNDIWKFDGKNWTWVSGDSSFNKNPNRGKIGQSNGTNNPGARADSYFWKDSSNTVRLFGGRNEINLFGDFWKWDGTNWTWYAGDSIDTKGFNPGTKGIESSKNNPGQVRGNIWVDKTNTLWMFGGYRTGYLNMLWRCKNGIWTWMAGDDSVNVNGVYGNLAIQDSINYPGARHSKMSWLDKSGKLFLFGGYGFDSNSDYPTYLNDFWTYDFKTQLNNLDEISLKKVTGYPNPTSDYLYFNEGLFSYEIYNSSGTLSMKGKNVKSVNISSLISGNYIILIQKNDNTSGYFKFQKMNN